MKKCRYVRPHCFSKTHKQSSSALTAKTSVWFVTQNWRTLPKLSFATLRLEQSILVFEKHFQKRHVGQPFPRSFDKTVIRHLKNICVGKIRMNAFPRQSGFATATGTKVFFRQLVTLRTNKILLHANFFVRNRLSF